MELNKLKGPNLRTIIFHCIWKTEKWGIVGNWFKCDVLYELGLKAPHRHVHSITSLLLFNNILWGIMVPQLRGAKKDYGATGPLNYTVPGVFLEMGLSVLLYPIIPFHNVQGAYLSSFAVRLFRPGLLWGIFDKNYKWYIFFTLVIFLYQLEFSVWTLFFFAIIN